LRLYDNQGARDADGLTSVTSARQFENW